MPRKPARYSNRAKGRCAETYACGYLRRQGLQILERNYRKGDAEIDIIAYASGGILLFVEVKSVTGSERGRPQSRVGATKQKKIWKGAWRWCSEHPTLAESIMRFDVIAISLHTPGPQTLHFIEAFAGPAAQPDFYI